jgi:surfeit locus 1 family protein
VSRGPYAGVVSGPLAPRFWGVHLLALVLVAAAGALGYWQLESWRANREREAVDLSQVAPVPLADVMGSDDPFPGDKVGQPVVLSGTWVPSGTLYVSGREHDGRSGYWVVTPLAVDPAGDAGDATAPAIPVVLGWVAEPAEAPAAPTGAGDLVAYLQPTEGTGQVDTDPNDDVLPQLRTADVIQHVDQDLYGAYAVARDGLGGLTPGDLAQLPETSAFTGLRNLLYAVEWWVFGGFAGFIWWRYVRDQLALDRPSDGGGGASGPDPSPEPPESTPLATPEATPDRAPEITPEPSREPHPVSAAGSGGTVGS